MFFLCETPPTPNTIVKICMFNYTAETHYVCVCAHTRTRHTSVGIVLHSKQRLTIGSVDWMSGSCCNS